MPVIPHKVKLFYKPFYKHRNTIFVILISPTALAAGKVNERLVHLWTLLSDDEKVVYSKVAKNEMLLIQGKDISESKQIKSEPCSNNDSENKRRLFHQVYII